MSDLLAQTVAGSILLVVVIAAVVGLSWHGTLTGPEAFSVLSTIITLGGGALAVGHGAKVATKASAPADPPA